jgi:serine/threonine protein kinase
MGPYKLLEIVGRGGMGTVYRAVHEGTGRVVAVKVMAKDLASDAVLLRRFEQEYSAASRLRHPHIVQGLDFGIGMDQPYLVMEFVDGETLGASVRNQGPLPEPEALRIIVQVADALHLAHQNRLIHRDVKPDNILLTREGEAKLADLGLIKDLDAGTLLTRPKAGLGTITFTAPEQFGDAQHADARCDVYSLGATLYFALTGVAPFQGRGNLTILQKKLANEFLPPSHRVPSLNVAVDRAICQALEADPQRRVQSAAEFAELLGNGGPASQWSSSCPRGLERKGQALLQTVEQRRARRFPSARDASCRLAGHMNTPWKAELQDVSLTGLCLQVEHSIALGADLSIEVPDSSSGLSSVWSVRVRWVREVAPRKWTIGCAFEKELSENELTVLLDNKAPTVVVQPGKLVPHPLTQ